MTVLRPLVVLCPHFDPDTAPTGVVMTRIVDELVELGHTVHVVTSLPWYRSHRIEPGWEGRLVRTAQTPWGSITRCSIRSRDATSPTSFDERSASPHTRSWPVSAACVLAVGFAERVQ